MKHVFVETNWVVAWAAPAHHRVEAAAQLLARAEQGELMLHLPAICLTEAGPPISERYQPKAARAIRDFLQWAAEQRVLSDDDVAASRRVLERFELAIRDGLKKAPQLLEDLRHHRAIEVFPLDDEMLSRAVSLTALKMQLKPFDQAILAGILVRAERLARHGDVDLSFCELDADLQPWVRGDDEKARTLTRLYDDAGLWVYGDFELRSPAPYSGWNRRPT